MSEPSDNGKDRRDTSQPEENRDYTRKVYPPSKDEAKCFYYGLPSQPKLIARLSSRTQPWKMRTWPNARPPRKVLSAATDTRLCKQWEQARDAMVHCLQRIKLKWCSLDLVQLADEGQPSRPIIWIGLEEAEDFASGSNAIYSVAGAVAQYDSLSDLDIQVRYTGLHQNCPPWFATTGPLDNITAELRPIVGIKIGVLNSGFEGTGAVYLKNESSEVFLLTARHVLFAHSQHTVLPGAAPEFLVGLLSDSSAKQLISDAEDNLLHLTRVQSWQANVGASNVDTDRRLEIARHNRNEVLPLLIGSKDNERVIGNVYAAPSLAYNQPYTEDWALIRLHNADAQNAIYLGDEFRAKPETLSAKMGQVPNADSQAMLSITHVLPDRQATTKDKNVMMRGSASGLSVGQVLGAESVTHRSYQGADVISLEYAIVGKNSCAFSKEGDSGAAVVDGDGGISCMVTSGAGTTAANDVTYATPLWWILERINAFTGQNFSLL